MKNALVSVIIPMYNEKDNVESTIEAVAKSLAVLDVNWEIIIVDDGSTDGTATRAHEISSSYNNVKVVSYAINKGRGYALRTGFVRAKGDIVVTIDADLSYHPDNIPEVVQVLNENSDADIVVGSPYMPGGTTEEVPFLRLLVSKIGNKVLSFALPGKISTSTGIFRAYRKDVIDAMELESDGKEIHIEILSKALALNYNIYEFPAVLRSRKKGKSKFKFGGTAISHIIFSLFEKPVILFGIGGCVLLTFGLWGGIYIAYLRYAGMLNPDRPLINLVIILVVAGFQILSFGFISTQIVILRKEILRLQRDSRLLKRKLPEWTKD